MSIKNNLSILKSKLAKEITLVAVSKTKPISDILEAYNSGQRIFGENKIQEMTEKHNELPKDIKWHMIGHLQRNKIKYIAHYVDLIHGVDSFKILVEINKQAKKHNRVINCLLQAKIAQEETKFGLSFNEIENILFSDELKELDSVNIIGLMGMASFTSKEKQVEAEFLSLATFFTKLKTLNNNLEILSMGMSGDYKLAIKCGSNMIRVGSAIFGSRN
ncbi:MAG TPA: YggS family pyridoxal phosphate-dependent enzyme [Flavobacteriaceae bacterium]|nr:YggS family pyridoxal phosphate-dependent enzyme [Flavobacteriaceae bacterium]HIP27522.1 YggS family pyridoxal phosphate-dependent enzyme [Flavobacteriaceae bacterium]